MGIERTGAGMKYDLGFVGDIVITEEQRVAAAQRVREYVERANAWGDLESLLEMLDVA